MYSIDRYLEAHKKTRLTYAIIVMILSAFIQVFILQTFMQPLNLISGGFTGLSLFISRIFESMGLDVSTSVLIMLLNTPAALLCYKSISKRFVLLSVIQYTLVSLFLNLFTFHPLFADKVLNLLFGGIGWGMSIAIALQVGGSTGGTDFIAQFVSNRIHRGIFQYVFYGNCCMYVLYGALFGWLYAGYSIIFQFLSTQAINSFYHRYTQVTMNIYTQDPDQVTDAFLATVQHGITIMEGTGGYTGQKVWILQSVIGAGEVGQVIHSIRQVDPHCIINTYKTKQFIGNFHQKPIE